MLERDQINNVLAVVAHPDDVDFGAAGTLAGFAADGISVSIALCTDGDAGGFDPSVLRSEIPSIRQAEQRAASAAIGVKDLHFFGYPDGALEVTIGLRKDISRVIRQVRPELVLIQSPERNWDRIFAAHPDHMAAGDAAIQAIYPDAQNPFAHADLLLDEGLEAWKVHEVWVMGFPRADHYVDITEHFPAKVEALRSHVSQTSHHPDLEGMLREWATRNAVEAGLPEGRLAEAFFVRSLPV